MTTPFIIGCALMLLAAIALLVRPLLRRLPAEGQGKRAVPPPRSTPAAVAAAVVLPVAAGLLYSGITSFPWQNPHAASASLAEHSAGTDSMEQVTAELEARLRQNPSDLEGWRMLARTYVVTGTPAKAVPAYEKAIEVDGGRDPSLPLDLAEAMVLADDVAMQPRAREIIDAALAADAKNPKALWYSGVLAYRADDVATAKARWLALLEQNPPPEIRQIVASQLEALGVQVPGSAGDAAGAMAGGSAGPGMAAGEPADTGPEPVGRTVRVAVSVDASLAGRLQPGTPVFVSARQPGIPGPPLAATRLTTDDLPTVVVLSDANSMIEGRNLSSVDDVEVVARVAFGGTAQTASGDLTGKAIHAKGAAPELAVRIDKVAP